MFKMLKKKCALVTMVRNEKNRMKLFLDYYKQHIQLDDIYVINHESTDGCCDNLDCNVWHISYPYREDQQWYLNTMMEYHRYLLQSYEYVLWVESDEFIIPFEMSLNEFLKMNTKPFVRFNGFEVIHMKNEEADIDLTSNGILKQRKYWYWNDHYSKVILFNEPLTFTLGSQVNIDVPISQDLYLVHLAKLDYKLGLERSLKNSLDNISLFDKERCHAQNNYCSTEEQYYFTFYKEYMDNKEIVLIPDWIKERL